MFVASSSSSSFVSTSFGDLARLQLTRRYVDASSFVSRKFLRYARKYTVYHKSFSTIYLVAQNISKVTIRTITITRKMKFEFIRVVSERNCNGDLTSFVYGLIGAQSVSPHVFPSSFEPSDENALNR